MGHEIAWMLWAQFWQVSLLIFAVALLSRWLGQNRPHLTHALWVVVLLKALTPPLWSSPSGVFSWMQTRESFEEKIEADPPNELPPSAAASVPQVMPDMPIEPLPEGQTLFAADILEGAQWDRGSTDSPAEVVADPFEHAEVSRPSSGSTQPEVPPGDNPFMRILLLIWIAGAVGSMGLACLRWMARGWEIQRAGLINDPLALELLEQLQARLRLRRKVRLIISPSRIGPAVLGLFRPTVLIPGRVIHGKAPADLEPILAHELIHVRRGDLWVGWLQVLVQAAWWFHPLIHFACRWLKHDAERCCDEEVLAELGIKPARYARALLDVLELKHVLKPVPALPGVRPVEITQKRLERIMRLGQGCRKRTPWWCWLVMLLAAALTLPGAAFVASAKEKPQPTEDQEGHQAKAASGESRTYKVGDLIQRMRQEENYEEESSARAALAGHLKAVVGEIWQAEQFLYSEKQAGTPSLWIKGNTLTVCHTPRVQEEIAHQLNLLREHGFQQIIIEAMILTANRELLEKSVPKWEAITSAIPPRENPAQGSAENSRAKASPDSANVAQMLIEKSVPMRLALLDEERLADIVKACQADAQTNLMHCPKVVVFNGQSATIQSLTRRPFVTGLSEGQPQIRVVSEGLSLKLRSVLEEQHIRLESEITLSDIKGVEVVTLPGDSKAANPAKVEVPEVATTRIRSLVKVPDGGSVLLGGLKPTDDAPKADQQLFVLLKVARIKATQLEPPRKEAEEVRQSQILPSPPKKLPPRNVNEDLSDVEVRYAQRAAELAELAYQKALEANRQVKGAMSETEISRLKLQAERAHLQAEQAKHAFQVKEQRTGAWMHGVGVNSDAGVVGQMVLNEKNFETTAIEPPTDEEVLKALGKPRDANGKPRPHAERKNVVITKERISQRAEPPKVYPQVGLGQVHHARFKCTVHFDEVNTTDWPVPSAKSVRKQEVVFIYSSRLVGLDKLPLSAPIETAVMPAAHYIPHTHYVPPAQKAPTKAEAVRSWDDLTKSRANSNRSEAEKAIEEKLAQKVSLHFKASPLNEVLKQVASQSGLNIVLDNGALAEEGLSTEHPITLNVDDVKLSSALNAMLKPLRLCHAVEDEVLKVTSKTRIESATLEVITYPVADLVVPIPQQITVDLRKETAKVAPQTLQGAAPTEAEFADLSQLIVSTVQPETWSENAGYGVIRAYAATSSLVVRQSRKVHEELRDLLEQLRRLQDVQVCLEIRTLEVESIENKDLAKKLALGKPVTLTPDEVEALRLSLNKGKSLKSWDAPKLTVFNGQTAHVIFPSEQEAGFGVDLNPVISADRRFVRLGLRTNTEASPQEQSNAQSLLKDGHSVLVNVAKEDGKTTAQGMKLSLVTPKIIVQEEEEERLGLEAQ